jgi:transcriptional regulator with XRE-family HTH domain
LQEKLRGLRGKRELTLAEVANATGITLLTLERIESGEDNRARYQDLATLAKRYVVYGV